MLINLKLSYKPKFRKTNFGLRDMSAAKLHISLHHNSSMRGWGLLRINFLISCLLEIGLLLCPCCYAGNSLQQTHRSVECWRERDIQILYRDGYSKGGKKRGALTSLARLTNYFYSFGDTTGHFASMNILPLVASLLLPVTHLFIVILGIPNNLLALFSSWRSFFHL